MKAAILRGPREVEFGTRPDPAPQPGEVLVQVKAVGICGSDLHVYRHGGFGNVVVNDLVQGHEPAGVVVEIGAGVNRFRPGDRVAIEPGIYCGCCEPCVTGRPNICPNVKYLSAQAVDGAFCEYLSRPERTLLPLPESLSFEEGAMLEPLAIAVHAVRASKLRLGDHVVILGAGSIGLTILQAARCAGATKIYVFDRLDHRLEVAKKLGADGVANIDDADPLEVLKDWTHGRLCDRVFEAVGKPESFALSVKMPALGGTVVLVGLCAGEVSLPLERARLGEVNILSLRREAHAYKAALELVESGRIDVQGLVTHRFALSVKMPALGGTVVLVGLCAGEVGPLERARLGEVNILKLRREAHAYKAALELVESGRIDVQGLVTHRLPLSHTGEAMEIASSYLDNAVKVIVNPT